MFYKPFVRMFAASLALKAPISRSFFPSLVPNVNRGTFGPSSSTRCDESSRAWSSLAASTSSSSAVPANSPAAPKKGKKTKKRLDELCLERFPNYSRNVIQSFIAQGKVLVDDRVVDKAGSSVADTAVVVLNCEEPKYVCRGGLKLEKALDHFRVDPAGRVCLDSGLSTGGFTDCMLQRGATRVYGVDVGYGQVAERVRVDPRVVVMERTNLRHLRPGDLPERVSLVTLDLSFISVLKVMPAVTQLLEPEADVLVLIKPQFEAGRQHVGSGGVVRDPKVHEEVVARVTGGICALGFELKGVTESPIRGDKSGNIEFLAHLHRAPGIVATVDAAAAALAETREAEKEGAEGEGAAAAEAQPQGAQAGSRGGARSDRRGRPQPAR